MDAISIYSRKCDVSSRCNSSDSDITLQFGYDNANRRMIMGFDIGKQERDTIWRCNISVRCNVYKSHLNCRFAAYEEELRAMASQPYFRFMFQYFSKSFSQLLHHISLYFSRVTGNVSVRLGETAYLPCRFFSLKILRRH